MKGNWVGTYTYWGKRIPTTLQNQATQFKIEITEFDGKHFSGTVQDDVQSGGMEEMGTITGSVKNEKVNFTKQMPNQSVFLPNGLKWKENKPHRKIYYSGKLTDNQLNGTWMFKFGIGKVANRWAIFPKSKGAWQMKKVE